MHRRAWLLTTGFACLGAACAHHKGGPDTADAAPPPRIAVRVNVVNSYSIAVNVIALSGGTSYRMGTVYPGMTTQFLLRESMMGKGPVEFLAAPTNGDTPWRSGALLLGSGDVVDFEIGPNLLNSSATIRQ